MTNAAKSRLVPAAILAVSLGSLAAALIAQFGFGLQPCILCLYQRVPYAVAALLALPALLPVIPERRRAALVALCGLIFLIGGGIAVFHVGVEQHWWAGTSACAGTPIAAVDLNDLQAALNTKPVVHCEDVQWRLFGISMAGYNVAASALWGILSLIAARRIAKEKLA